MRLPVAGFSFLAAGLAAMGTGAVLSIPTIFIAPISLPINFILMGVGGGLFALGCVILMVNYLKQNKAEQEVGAASPAIPEEIKQVKANSPEPTVKNGTAREKTPDLRKEIEEISSF